MRDRAAQARVDLAVDRPRDDHPLDEPDRRAVGEDLELGDARTSPSRRSSSSSVGSVSLRRPRERAERPVEPALPAVRARERERVLARSAAASALRARSRSRSVGASSSCHVELRERPARSSSGRRRRIEERARLLPERARLARRAVVGRRLADEVEAARRPRARRVEEVALARDRHPASARRARRDVSSISRRSSSARNGEPCWRRGKLPSSRPSRKTTSVRRVRARSRSCTATRPGSSPRASLSDARSSAAKSSSRESAPPSSIQRCELVEELRHGTVRAQVEHGVLADRRRVEAVGGAEHRAGELADGRERVGVGAEVVEHPQRLPAQLERLLDDPLGIADRPPAQPPLEVVDVRARQAGERRAEEAVQVVAAAVAPLEAQEREERLAERRLADPDAPLDRVRDAERAERGLELGALALDARADDEDLLRRSCRRGSARAPRRRRARACRARRRPRGSGSRRRAAAPAAGRPRRGGARGARAPGGATSP